MNSLNDPHNHGLATGEALHGYRLLRAVDLPEINSFFYELDHPPTGARHVHISRADRENTFGVVFRTVPQDSTGVAHILEHTVLCGSERFPVRDPFFSMLKRSLSTFMNAFTASDWTMYPFASQNRKDFYNLMDVYLDAAFFPRLEELSFKQEGCRRELEGEGTGGSALVYKGIVFNEMKGAMSSPDQVMVRSMLKALYPDTTYSNNSGGDPAAIPALTYSGLREFHRRHYHPSNACFFSYGDLPLRDHLGFVARAVLSRFQAIAPATGVPSQPRWESARQARFSYPFARGEDPTRKHQVCVAWLGPDIRETAEVLSMALLEQILIGNAASPLRQALIDSGLGTALSDGSGYDAENRDTLFAVGLKDTDGAAAERVERIIFDVLEDLAGRGIDAGLIESAIHQLEFHRKEITNTPYPYGIKLLLTLCGTWIHGGDPLRVLKFDADLAEIRRRVAAGRFFEGQLVRYLTQNTHRIRMVLAPDVELADREAARERAELEQIRQGLMAAEIEKIREDAAALERLQEAQESVEVLPTLERQDIPPDVEVVAPDDAEVASGLYYYRQPTSGIVYAAAAAGSGGLPEFLNHRVPFFCHAFARVGTALRDYAEIARRIDAVTGGIGLAAQPRTAFRGSGACLPFVALNTKSLVRNLQPMMELLAEMIGGHDFSDLNRLKNVLLEYRAGLESMVVHNGHRLAISMAARNFSAANALSESWSGIQQLRLIKELADDIREDRLAALSADLKRIGRHVFSRGNFQLTVIGEEPAITAARPLTADILATLSPEAGGFQRTDLPPGGGRIREGWSTATAVNFVAAAHPAVRLGHPDSAPLAVIAKMLRSLFLHREIREKGGAYGGFALYNSEDGFFSLASYRDPHLTETLEVFQRAADFIRSGAFSETDVKEAILQVCSEVDKPDPPGPAARKAFYRRIVALSDDLRRQFKQRLIALERREVAEVAERYFAGGLKEWSVAVIGSEENLKSANAKLEEPLALHKI
jgi:Zn-dependent M16 (insulinase) family peptidase